jgi:hypothetical protein
MDRDGEQDTEMVSEETIRINQSIANETALWSTEGTTPDMEKDRAYVQAFQRALNEELAAADAATPAEITPLLTEVVAMEQHLDSWRHWEQWASPVQGWKKPDALPFVFGAMWRAKSVAALAQGIPPEQAVQFEQAMRRRRDAFFRAVQRARQEAPPTTKLSHRIQAVARRQAEEGASL